MSGADRLVLGDWNAACSMCGRKRKASELVKNWQGDWRCPEHNEPRHPQEYVRAGSSERPPPFVQPPSDLDIFTGNFCTTRTSAIDDAIIDCAVVDFIPEA